MKKWELKHNENDIAVEKRYNRVRLYVNGESQDERMEFIFRAKLSGRLPSGEKIKASLRGAFAVYCVVFVDDKLVLSE